MKRPSVRRDDIHRGDVWQVEFDPAIGAEINKTRPAVVASDDSWGFCPYGSSYP